MSGINSLGYRIEQYLVEHWRQQDIDEELLNQIDNELLARLLVAEFFREQHTADRELVKRLEHVPA